MFKTRIGRKYAQLSRELKTFAEGRRELNSRKLPRQESDHW
jgi:hypothetical protein